MKNNFMSTTTLSRQLAPLVTRAPPYHQGLWLNMTPAFTGRGVATIADWFSYCGPSDPVIPIVAPDGTQADKGSQWRVVKLT
ncbi:unnamed protein product, partial [Iphiclides podalirius]